RANREYVSSANPRTVDVQRPRAVLQNIFRHGSLEGLAGQDDWLMGGLERGTPPCPLFSHGSRRLTNHTSMSQSDNSPVTLAIGQNLPRFPTSILGSDNI